uniref:Uncharacterized protein n=1 Tax=Physcomitrium patens TaxID=3218 RepID=A0A2K1JHJ7_PHYPA|nr:hypothetical protein PHYPA_018433 [Physcomitrium patens]
MEHFRIESGLLRYEEERGLRTALAFGFNSTPHCSGINIELNQEM